MLVPPARPWRLHCAGSSRPPPPPVSLGGSGVCPDGGERGNPKNARWRGFEPVRFAWRFGLGLVGFDPPTLRRAELSGLRVSVSGLGLRGLRSRPFYSPTMMDYLGPHSYNYVISLLL
jgi:hypothetical protein